MKSLLQCLRSSTLLEKGIYGGSVLGITLAFLLFDREQVLTLIASLIGVTSLIFCAKGHPFGQVLMVIFSLLYGIISFACAYYGEMLTYIGMTLPMAVLSLVEWVRHPFEGDRSQVAVRRLTRGDVTVMSLSAVLVTAVFYGILARLGTANLLPSTVSVTTSYIAAFLTFRRSPYFALAYAANDIVLIVLWVLAALTDPAYWSVTVCFAAFLVNDLYGFISWRRMEKHQSKRA